jgi:hypothetical protein
MPGLFQQLRVHAQTLAQFVAAERFGIAVAPRPAYSGP